MPFDNTVIPSTGRSPAAMAAHYELYKRSEDIWKVYNPTDKDILVKWDARRTNQRYVVPNKNKDVGHGKGCQLVPKYVMENYRDHLIVELINQKSHEEWEKKKMEFRLEDRPKMEENLALRINNPAEWDHWVPIIVKGVVTRFGGEDIEEPEEVKPDQSGSMSMGEAAMERLGMTDFDAGIEIEQNKADFIDQIK